MRHTATAPEFSTSAAALAESMHREYFTPRSSARMLVGVEVERLVVDENTLRPAPLFSADGPSLAQALRAVGEREGWCELATYEGSPRFRTRTGGVLSFEPGGQLEYAAAPHSSVSHLLRDVTTTFDAVQRELEEHGWRLLAVGLDPHTPLVEAALQLAGPRYRRMSEYLAARGTAGARMMRQTAALQVSVDRGLHPGRLWLLLQACTPSLVALTANSRLHEGRDTGHASYRADSWRRLDDSRTGVLGVDLVPSTAADVYTAFALAAPDIFHGDGGGEWKPFVETMSSVRDVISSWQRHLTTLFPEVRPRGWFEVRSCDAVPDAWMPLPLAVVLGVAYDSISAEEAESLLTSQPTTDLLELAGRSGMDDETVRATSLSLVDIALEGCARIGAPLFDGEMLERARDLRDRSSHAETPALNATGMTT